MIFIINEKGIIFELDILRDEIQDNHNLQEINLYNSAVRLYQNIWYQIEP